MLVLQASASVQEAYSRLPLLLSPSRHQAFPRDLATTLVEDVYNGEDATTDGASDIGWRDAVRLNLLDISSRTKSTCSTHRCSSEVSSAFAKTCTC